MTKKARLTSRTARRLPFEITDDSGFLAIIDPDAYQGFVHVRWNWKTINQHFRQKMRDRHLLIWGTGLENFWNVEVWFSQFKGNGFREIVGSIEASRGRLLLTNYESLSLAAGSEKVTLPEAHERELVVSVTPGLYDCRIVQLSDPESEAPFEEPVSWIFQITPANAPKPAWRKIPWSAE